MEGGATTKTSRQGPRLSPDVTSGEVWQCRWLHWPETDQRLQMSAGNSWTLRLSSLHHHSHHRHLPSKIPVICAFNLRNRDRLQPTVTPCRASPICILHNNRTLLENQILEIFCRHKTNAGDCRRNRYKEENSESILLNCIITEETCSRDAPN